MLLDLSPLPQRAINILRAAGYTYDTDLAGVNEKIIKELPGFGAVYLTELKIYLKGRKIKLTKDKKEKAAPKWHPRSRELVLRMLPKGEINFSIEVPAAGRLLQEFEFEDVVRVKLPSHVNSLRWLVSGIGGWANRLVNSAAPAKLVEKTEKLEIVKPEAEEIEEIEYKKVERPLDLASFLGLKK